MQLQQNQKEINENRFQQIDQRWAAVEYALRVEDAERQQDLSKLKQQLEERKSKQNNIDERKTELLGYSLNKLKAKTQESKQNMESLFEGEAQFRIAHLDKKNQLIQNYFNDSNAFASTLQQYATNKIKDIHNKLQSIGANNLSQTHQTIKHIKDEVIGQTQDYFAKEKDKYSQLLTKMGSDANKSMDQLRELMRVKKRQREQSQAKLKVMVGSLIEQLAKISDLETKQGEMTYDCMLKLMEQCCAKIQQAQLR